MASGLLTVKHRKSETTWNWFLWQSKCTWLFWVVQTLPQGPLMPGLLTSLITLPLVSSAIKQPGKIFPAFVVGDSDKSHKWSSDYTDSALKSSLQKQATCPAVKGVKFVSPAKHMNCSHWKFCSLSYLHSAKSLELAVCSTAFTRQVLLLRKAKDGISQLSTV